MVLLSTSVLPFLPFDLPPFELARAVTAFTGQTLEPLAQAAIPPITLRAAQAVGVVAVKTLPEVIDALRAWIMGILAAVATLFLVVGGLRYMTAAGDPAAVEQAKGSLKAALTGYALAVLAPVLLQVLQGILGG